MRRLFIILRPFVEPGSVPLLFIVFVVLHLISNALFDWTKSWVGTPLRVAFYTVLAIVLLVAGFELVRRFRLRVVLRSISPRRGLIVLISRGRPDGIPAKAAIDYHLPALQHCWLITSTELPNPPSPPAQSAWRNAGALKVQYEGKARMHIKVIDPEDPQSIFQAVEQVYSEAESYGLSAKEMVADFTGGTKMMTAGMVLACTPADRDVQYMKPLAVLGDGKPDISSGSEPRWVDLNFFLGSVAADAKK
ncbi:MAG TPA: hypothetical protein VFB82_23615 [Blastocatellia bacterium]|nr:hypothetical protein [Blastocatellia bacterium]